jgi:hypothetical protein
VTIPPILKTVVRHGRTLVFRAAMDQGVESRSESNVQSVSHGDESWCYPTNLNFFRMRLRLQDHLEPLFDVSRVTVQLSLIPQWSPRVSSS